MARFAIVVGIDSYKDQRWNLGAAVDDAIEFAKWALGPGGVEPENLRLLLSPRKRRRTPVPYEPADSRTIRKTVAEFQGGAGAGGERLYVYYAGHGVSAPGATKGPSQEPVLIPADVETFTVDYNLLVGFSQLITALDAVQPREQLFFIDACRGFELENHQPGVGQAVGPWAPDRSGASAQFVLYGTSLGQRAYESEALNRAVFADVLFEALRGKRPAAAVWKARNECYEVRFSTLAEQVKAAVKQRVEDAAALVQVPEQVLIGGSDAVVSTLSADEMGTFPVRVRVGPSKALEHCELSIRLNPPGIPEVAVVGAGPPADASVKFDVAPNDYVLQAAATGYSTFREPCVVEGPRNVRVKLAASPEAEAADGARKTGSLVVQADDPTAVVVVRDSERAVRSSGPAPLTLQRLQPALYRVQLVTVEGATTEQVVEVKAGPATSVTLEAPGAQLGSDQLAMLESVGISESDGYLHPSDDLHGFANARFASLLAFGAFAAYWPGTGDFQRLREFGVTPLELAQDQAGLTLLVGASGDRPTPGVSRDEFLERAEFVARDLEGQSLGVGDFKPLSGLPAAAETSLVLAPGCLTVELRLPGLAPTRYALAALPGRVTVLVAVAEDTGEVDVQQYLIPVSQEHENFLMESPDNIRRLEVAQRYYASGRELPEDEALKRLLAGKWLDPLLGALAGYGLVRAGKPEEYRRAAMRNMLRHFGGLPDSHVLAGLCDPKRRDQHFSAALELGLPVFADGFRAIHDWYRKGRKRDRPLWVQPSLLLPGSPWTAWVSSRPVLRVTEGVFEPAPAGWAVLEQKRGPIERALKSVGRIVPDSGPVPYLGTAFVVAPGLVMTVGFEGKGDLDGHKPSIDFSDGEGSPPISFAVEEQRLVGKRFAGVAKVKVELLRVAETATDGSLLPEPLDLAADLPGRIEGRLVYAAGYPALDMRVPEDVRMLSFGDVYGVKRLQPGQLLGIEDGVFTHDCLTLGGNGGSPIVDVETGLVIGLHYAGFWINYKRGEAIALWKLAARKTLEKAGVRFA